MAEAPHEASSSRANLPGGADSERLGEIRDQLKLLADYL
jgi:hypothetical protein